MTTPERDPHLLAALRHAPDHDAAPPPEVTARILAAAREAVRPAPRASVVPRWLAWWVTPQGGAAFATLAVAMLVGVMWSTHEPPPTEPVSAPEVVAVAPPVAATPPADAVASAAAPAQPAPPLAERRVAKAQRQRAAEADSAKAVAEALPAPPAAPVASPAPPAAVALPSPAAAAEAQALPPPAPAARSRDDVAAANPLGAAASRPAATTRLAAAASPALSRADAAAAYDPLLAVEAAGGSWSWQAAGLDGERPHGAAQRALWAALRAATQGRWEAAPASVVPPPAPWLVLRQDARRVPFWVEGGTLHTLDPEGRAWRAPVGAARLAAWQAEVARW